MMARRRREKNRRITKQISIKICSPQAKIFWGFGMRFYKKSIAAGKIARRRREIFEVFQSFLRSEMHFS